MLRFDRSTHSARPARLTSVGGGVDGSILVIGFVEAVEMKLAVVVVVVVVAVVLVVVLVAVVVVTVVAMVVDDGKW